MGNVWQIGGGSTDRAYDKLFINQSVGLIGPGDSGRWAPDRYQLGSYGQWVTWFARDVGIGDRFILRLAVHSYRHWHRQQRISVLATI